MTIRCHRLLIVSLPWHSGVTICVHCIIQGEIKLPQNISGPDFLNAWDHLASVHTTYTIFSILFNKFIIGKTLMLSFKGYNQNLVDMAKTSNFAIIINQPSLRILSFSPNISLPFNFTLYCVLYVFHSTLFFLFIFFLFVLFFLPLFLFVVAFVSVNNLLLYTCIIFSCSLYYIVIFSSIFT